jgi:hypothetical protein
MIMHGQHSVTQSPNAATDPRIDPQVRTFLAELNKDSSPFWELLQPKPQEILTGLQNKTPVDMSGVTSVERKMRRDKLTVKVYIMSPQKAESKPGVLFKFTGASGSLAIIRTISDSCVIWWLARGKSACSSNTRRFPRRSFRRSWKKATRC